MNSYIGTAQALKFDISVLQVHTLEKVLRLKKDTVTQTVMLDEVLKVLLLDPRPERY